MDVERNTAVAVHCAHDELVPLTRLIPNPKNPNHHPDSQIVLLANVIAYQGWRAPITVSTRSGLIVRGHGRLEAARHLGLERAPVDYQDYESDEKELADLIADNRLSELSEIDEHLLADLLTGLDRTEIDLALTGYEPADLEHLLARLDLASVVTEDDIPDLSEAPVTQPGDVWMLGRHRLACGDARDLTAVRLAVGAAKPECLLTDPPYGIAYVGKTSRSLTIANDDAAGLPDLLSASFSAADAVLVEGSPFYVFHAAGALAFEFERAVREVGWHHHQTLIWVKDTLVLGRSDYSYRHEPILYGWTRSGLSSRRSRKSASRWFGDDAQTSVLEFERPKRSEEHPTSKPVALIAKLMRNSTPKGGVVLDPFLGSGTTLIAAERSGRICVGLEIDPAYCDLVVQRYQAITGDAAVRSRA